MLLRVIDFETTGLPPDAAVCEVGWTDLTVRDDATISVGRPHFMLVQPNRPMPPEARAVHHISDADLVGAPAIETGFIKIGAGAVDAFVAHNAQFERQFFTGGQRPRICTRKVAMRLWPESPNHQNQTLRYYIGIGEGDDDFDLDAHPPHRAGPDTFVTAHILAAALKLATVEQMIEWTSKPSLLPSPMRFGKHRGKRWDEAPRDYLDWIVRKSDMDEDTKFTAKHYLEEAL